MSLDAGSVYATLGGRFNNAGFHQFGSAMYRAQGQTEAFEKRQEQMAARAQRSYQALGTAAKVVAGGGILALGGAIVYSIKKAADFEQQLDSLASVSGASARQMKELRKQALDAGAATKYSALQAAQAQTELAKGGLSTTAILKGGLKAALSLAAAGELDLGDAAKYTVNAMKLFKLSGQDSIHIADAFATAANSTTADVQDFGMALVQGGGAARSAGYNFDQTVTILEAMAEVGVKNSDAGTSMKTALLQLIGPTKKQAQAAKDAGVSFLDQHGRMKDIVDISAMLRAKTGDMTKAQRTQLFQTLAGTDGFRTLLALYDAGPAKLERLQKGLDKQGTAAQVAAEKQDNLKGKLENLQGSVETAAIRIGTRLLPMFTQLASKATTALNAFVSSGNADKFAAGVAGGLSEAGRVIGDIARDGAKAADVLLDIGRALDLGDPTKIEAILAAIAGFKIAGFVAPMVAQLATAIGTLAMNARTAPSLAAFFGELALNPVTAVAVGVAALAAGLVLLSGRESAEAGVAKANAAAHKAQADAIKAVHDAELGAADAGLAAKQADLDHARAVERLNELRKKGKKGTDEYKQALLDVRQTALRAQATQNDYNNSVQAQNDANDKAVKGARDRLKSASDVVSELQKQVDLQTRVDNPATGKSIRVPENANPQTLRALAAAQQALNDRNRDYIQAVARANISDLDRQRLMHQSTRITDENALGVSNLIKNLDGVPKSVQAKLLVQSQDALAKAGTLADALTAIGKKQIVAKILTNAPTAGAAVAAFRAVLSGVPGSTAVRILQNAPSAKAAIEAFKAAVRGVPGSKILKILQNAPSAKAAVDALASAIANLPSSKTITLTTNEIHTISNRVGSRPVTPSGKVLPKAMGGKTNGPELWLAGEDGSGYDEYIVPTNPKHRGRALELFMQLAGDLGVGMYAKGKPGKGGHHRFIPSKKQYLRFDPTDITSDRDNAKNRLDRLEQDAKEKDSGGHLTRGALKARGQLAKARRDFQREKAIAVRANAFARRVQAQQDISDIAADQMRLADGNNDQSGYDRALGKRKAADRTLMGLLRDSLRYAKPGSAWARKVQQALGLAQLDKQDADTAVSRAAQDFADTGMTAAERAQLSGIDKNIALAALTATLTDDTSAATAKVNLLQGILGSLGGRGASNTVIADVAGQLKTARDNLASLTGGSATNTDANVQAQIDQANERARIAENRARISEAGLATLAVGNPNTIGQGVVQNIYTLHPADSRTLDAIGRAATAGQAQQGSVTSPRVNLRV